MTAAAPARSGRAWRDRRRSAAQRRWPVSRPAGRRRGPPTRSTAHRAFRVRLRWGGRRRRAPTPRRSRRVPLPLLPPRRTHQAREMAYSASPYPPSRSTCVDGGRAPGCREAVVGRPCRRPKGRSPGSRRSGDRKRRSRPRRLPDHPRSPGRTPPWSSRSGHSPSGCEASIARRNAIPSGMCEARMMTSGRAAARPAITCCQAGITRL